MKGISQIRGLGNIKSVHSVGAHSIGKAQRSSYLELYMLRREKDRLEKEIFVLDKRASTNKRQLDSINRRIQDLQKETHKKQRIKTCRSVPAKPLKTMAINY